MVGGAVLGDFFHHLLLLIHLDGKHAAVVAFVAEFADGGAEGLMQKGNLRIKNILDAEQYGQIIAACFELADDFQYADFRASFAPEGADDHFTFRGNVEIPGTPVADTVQIDGILHGPLLHRFLFGQRS